MSQVRQSSLWVDCYVCYKHLLRFSLSFWKAWRISSSVYSSNLLEMPRFCRPRTWQLNRAIGIFFSNDQFLFTMCTFSKKSLLLWIETFIAMSCDCIFPRDPVLERLHRFKMIAYCSFPRLRNPGCLLLVAIFAVLWENAVPSESFLACLRRRLQHFHNPCKFFFLSRGTVLLWCAGFVHRYLVRQTFWMFSNNWPGSNASQNG